MKCCIVIYLFYVYGSCYYTVFYPLGTVRYTYHLSGNVNYRTWPEIVLKVKQTHKAEQLATKYTYLLQLEKYKAKREYV